MLPRQPPTPRSHNPSEYRTQAVDPERWVPKQAAEDGKFPVGQPGLSHLPWCTLLPDCLAVVIGAHVEPRVSRSAPCCSSRGRTFSRRVGGARGGAGGCHPWQRCRRERRVTGCEWRSLYFVISVDAFSCQLNNFACARDCMFGTLLRGGWSCGWGGPAIIHVVRTARADVCKPGGNMQPVS